MPSPSQEAAEQSGMGGISSSGISREMRSKLNAEQLDHLKNVWHSVGNHMAELDEWRAKREGRPAKPARLLPPDILRPGNEGLRPPQLSLGSYNRNLIGSRPQSARAAPPSLVVAPSPGSPSRRPMSARTHRPAGAIPAPERRAAPPQPKHNWFDRNWASVEMDSQKKLLGEKSDQITQSETTIASLRDHVAKGEAHLASTTEALEASQALLSETRRELDEARDEVANLRAESALAKQRCDAAMGSASAEKKELFGRQVARHIANRDCILAFASWLAFSQARSHSMQRLRQVANRLRNAELAGAFYQLAADCDEAHRLAENGSHLEHAEALRRQVEEQQANAARAQEEMSAQLEEMSELHGELLSRQLEEQQAAAKQAQESMSAQLQGMSEQAKASHAKLEELSAAERAAHEERTASLRKEFEEQQVNATQLRETMSAQLEEMSQQAQESQAQLDELKNELAAMRAEMQAQKEASQATVDELAVAREKELLEAAAKEEEARREVFRRQAVRHMSNRDLSGGFRAWVEMWQSKTYAMKRMRECANRINPKLRDLASAFDFWFAECSAEGMEAQLADHERRASKMVGLLAIRDKEIKRLKTELQLLQPETSGAAEAMRRKREKARRKAGLSE